MNWAIAQPWRFRDRRFVIGDTIFYFGFAILDGKMLLGVGWAKGDRSLRSRR
ncbi:MAG: hypothetical protein ACUVQO_09365 [Leptodesmis sp.]